MLSTQLFLFIANTVAAGSAERSCYYQHVQPGWRNLHTCAALFLSQSHDNLSGTDIQALFSALEGSSHLHTLVLNGGLVDDQAARVLGRVLQNDTALRSLDLNDNSIGAEGAQALAAVLSGGVLDTLSLHGNELGAEGAYHIARAVRDSTSRLSTLDLGANGVGDAGAKHLAHALQHGAPLSSLVLAANGIGDSGAAALASALQMNNVLETLDLAGNQISAQGGAALAEGIEYNHALTHIGLSSNAGIARDDHRRMLAWIGRGSTHRRRTAEERQRGRAREL